MKEISKIQLHHLHQFKQQGKKIVCLTAYDYRTAYLIDQAGVDVILVGDSLANAFMGLSSTLALSLDEMIYHLKIIRRAVSRAFLVADMPFGSYQVSLESAVQNACQLVKEGAQAVKLEGANSANLALIERLNEIGIPVLAHIGYTPQESLKLGVGKIQGKTDELAEQLLKDALKLQQVGAFGVVLELMPPELGGKITQSLHIPTIGIGCGPECDGQILVSDDLLGKSERSFSFVKKYANLSEIILQSVRKFKEEVEGEIFPTVQNKSN